ncbi:hypothetical protein CMI47_06080 [Candidatus Pacearchaeota archaeon]|nr:hypothetical protein [Candidatus Pacearchaeota archaeon]
MKKEPSTYDRYEWNKLLKEKSSFRDVFKFKFVDMRFEYKNIFSLGWDNVEKQVMGGTFDFYEFLWGGKYGWIVFDENGKVISNKFPKYYSEETWNIQ